MSTRRGALHPGACWWLDRRLGRAADKTGMLVVETIAKVRRAHFVGGKGIKTTTSPTLQSVSPSSWRSGANSAQALHTRGIATCSSRATIFMAASQDLACKACGCPRPLRRQACKEVTPIRARCRVRHAPIALNRTPSPTVRSRRAGPRRLIPTSKIPTLLGRPLGRRRGHSAIAARRRSP